MSRSIDPQKLVGKILEAKALHVTSLAECLKRYGANISSKWLKGFVVNTTTTMSSTKNRTAITVTEDYNLVEGTIKGATITIRSFKAV